jgi:hypothetical protein
VFGGNVGAGMVGDRVGTESAINLIPAPSVSKVFITEEKSINDVGESDGV